MNVWSELREGMLISWGTLRANKMRSTLTTLGIVIGIVTVTLMGTAIEGLQQACDTRVGGILFDLQGRISGHGGLSGNGSDAKSFP